MKRALIGALKGLGAWYMVASVVVFITGVGQLYEFLAAQLSFDMFLVVGSLLFFVLFGAVADDAH